MTVYKKLQEARNRLNKISLSKSGKNAFAKFNYFELGDFMPAVTGIFNDVGLCGVVSFTTDTAYLTIYDVDGEERSFVTFTSPLVMASMDRVQPIQLMGSSHTYFRRYLYLMALDLVEQDSVDAVEPPAKVEVKAKVEPKVETKAKEEPKEETPKPKIDSANLKGKEGPWQLKLKEEGEWQVTVQEATNILLAIAKTKDDVNNIYKVNRVIYDKLKETNITVYEEIINVFNITKKELS